jgi:hypothetical protein
VRLASAAIERALVDYVSRYGDGWGDHNTLRLAAFVRIVDALAAVPELAGEIDKTVGQWFSTSEQLDAAAAHAEELRYLDRHGIALADVEHEVALKPGQLLFVDNLRSSTAGSASGRRARSSTSCSACPRSRRRTSPQSDAMSAT